MGCGVSAIGGLRGHQGSGMYKGKRENKDLITLTYLTNCCIRWPFTEKYLLGYSIMKQGLMICQLWVYLVHLSLFIELSVWFPAGACRCKTWCWRFPRSQASQSSPLACTCGCTWWVCPAGLKKAISVSQLSKFLNNRFVHSAFFKC